MLIAWLGHSTMGFLDDCFQVPKESSRSGITPGAELQNVANHLPSDVFLETPAWVPSKHEVLKPRTVGTIQLYQQSTHTWNLDVKQPTEGHEPNMLSFCQQHSEIADVVPLKMGIWTKMMGFAWWKIDRQIDRQTDRQTNLTYYASPTCILKHMNE